MRKPSSKTLAVIKALKANPNAKPAELAERFDVAVSYVYSLRKKMKEPKRKVTLTPSQVKVAKKLGVSLQDYVKEGMNLGVLKYDDEVAEQDTEGQPPEMVPMPDLGTTEVDQVLRERGNRYGTFEDNAKTCQLLKNVLHAQEGWYRLSYVQREAVGMMMFKISRLVNGDPTYIDTVIDIAGYNQLMLEHMRDKNERIEE